jgi:PEP-CTERM motif-containing protein
VSRMRTALSFGVCFFLCLLAAADARAEPIVVSSTAITTSGVFRCVSFWGRKVTCSGEGTNSVTFGSGDSTATLTFSGVTSTFDVTTRATPVTLGEFQLTANEGFTFQTHPINPTFPIVQLALNVEQTTPVPASSTGGMWAVGGRTSLKFYGTPNSYFFLPLGPNPYTFSTITYTIAPHPLTISPDGRTALTANVGTAPEPATIVLLGMGLLAAAGARRWRMVRRRFKSTAWCRPLRRSLSRTV